MNIQNDTKQMSLPEGVLLERFEGPFRLEGGGVLPGLQVAYHTYGTLNERRDNVVWVFHALTANSDVADWWPGTVEEGRFLDPSRFFVICANIIGSPYGTTGPMTTNPATGQPWYDSFPCYTISDIVKAHRLLAERLGIKRIRAAVGSSVGGFQALQWAVEDPDRFERLVLVATAPKASPWTIAADETQRMIIQADSTFGEPRRDAGAAGLAAARALGLLTYRGPEGYNLSQQDLPDFQLWDAEGAPALHRAQTYQRHQGDKLVARFDAYSYCAILQAFDTHDIGRYSENLATALASIRARTIVVGITTDIVFTPEEMRQLARAIPGAEYHEIESPFGHDGFLVESEQLNSIIFPFVNQP